MASRGLFACLFCLAPSWLLAAPPKVAAAEAAYADIVRQVAGPDATVATLLHSAAADPHDFEPTPAVARAVADADIVIANGLGYDAWLPRLGAASGDHGRAITVADLLQRQPGDNPHLWYDPAAMPALASTAAAALQAADPAHASGYAARCRAVLASLAVLHDRILRLRTSLAGMPVAATEPVFGLMQAALGLSDSHQRFELSQMNATEPRASDVAAVLDDLARHRVRVLFTDAQHSGGAADELTAAARQAGVAVVPISETLPAGQTYQAWIAATLDTVQGALR